MKKVLFAIPALALTLFFTFCQKAETTDSTTPATVDLGASDRGPCPIDIHLSNFGSSFTTCGIGVKNTSPCTTCLTSTFTTGVATFSSDITLNPPSVPITFSIQNTSGSGDTLRLVTSTDQESVWIPAFGCREITVNANCEIQ